MNESEWLKCTKCNIPLKPAIPTVNCSLEQIDDGERIIFHGGYGMFYDDIDLFKIKDAFLCHDCMVELLEWFPEEFRKQFKGGHPYSHKPDGKCCEYAWSFKKPEEEIE